MEGSADRMQISVVIPVYRSATILPALAQRVHAVLQENFQNYELVLVNDCSPDDSWRVIKELAERYDFIVGLDLRRNVGQDNALMAGLNSSRGDVVVIMDDDLQHSPEDIPLLCSKLSEGHDVCYAQFEIKRQMWWKNIGSDFNGWVARWVIDKPGDIYLSPFKALSRGVVNELIKYQGPFAYVDGLIWTVTSRCSQVPVMHQPRMEGKGNYNLARSIRVWLKLLTGFSVRPLRLITVVGLITSCLSFLAGAFFLLAYLVDSTPVRGWPSLFVSISFIGGIQLVSLGVLGEYMGRTYLRVSDRPQYSIRQVEGRN
jgi:undecaprenyl-phosphate 4-deoxy-4-formamido-L-arabinose transferase